MDRRSVRDWLNPCSMYIRVDCNHMVKINKIGNKYQYNCKVLQRLLGKGKGNKPPLLLWTPTWPLQGDSQG